VGGEMVSGDTQIRSSIRSYEPPALVRALFAFRRICEIPFHKSWPLSTSDRIAAFGYSWKKKGQASITRAKAIGVHRSPLRFTLVALVPLASVIERVRVRKSEDRFFTSIKPSLIITTGYGSCARE
jgi:hypothetical protein